MPIKKNQLLDLARELAQHESEAHLRTAISKAYYFAYHDCLDWIHDLPDGSVRDGANGGVHQRLIESLRTLTTPCTTEQQKQGKQRSYALLSLKGHRTKADYCLDKNIDPITISIAIKTAENIAFY